MEINISINRQTFNYKCLPKIKYKIKVMVTAEKFWLDKYFSDSISDEDKKLWLECNNQAQSTVLIMIEFAKMHVQAALGEASKEGKILVNRSMSNGYDYSEHYINKDSILNSYPKSNIK